MKIRFGILSLALLVSSCSGGQDAVRIPRSAPWSQRIADSFLLRHPDAVTYDSGSPDRKWNYEQGLMLVALLRMWRHSGETRYFDFVRDNLDRYVDETGAIATYKPADYNLDNIAPGRALLEVHRETVRPKYRIAADALCGQLRDQPRTAEGGFWHKNIYPNQMWLDGLFMAEPFYARYAVMLDDQAAFDDIADQFIMISRHTKDTSSGLLYHAWDESKREQWSDSLTGCSPSFWGRAMGWYAMALVDVLDDVPIRHPRRAEMVGILHDLAGSILKFRDPETHLWYQVVDQGKRPGNYLEASASCMFAYVFAKGAARGYLDEKYFSEAERTFRSILKEFVTVDAAGLVNLHGTCRGAGLGGRPYRDGSYNYYTGEPLRMNDMKGIGAFLLAAIELEEGKSRIIKSEE